MIGNTLLLRLLGAVLLLPTAILLLILAGLVLSGMGDQAGAVGLYRIAVGGGLIWILAIIALVAAVAVRVVTDNDRDSNSDA